MRRAVLISLLIILLLYVSTYAWIRQTHVEVWEKDQNAYVIFPEDKVYLYYLYRPLSYLDNLITGMRFHIGQHR
jgi:hypothetical protein